MKALVEKLYCRMPVPLQNAAVSALGLRYNRRRYGGRYREYVDELMRSQWQSKATFEELQLSRLRSMLTHVAKTVPYYRNALNSWAHKLEQLTWDQFRELPCLEKRTLRSQLTELLDRSRFVHGTSEGHTSGTSGTPLVWPYDNDSVRLNLAFRERQYRWAGLTGREMSARFSGRLIIGLHERPPFWRYNHAEKQWLFSTYHLNAQHMPAYFAALQEISPTYLDGYPSALFSLARWVNHHGLAGRLRLWAVFTTAETILDDQRAEIARAFGCRVWSFYSSSEGAPFITTCPAGRLHMNPESGVFEFLRWDGSPALPGEEAELVVTSFFQRTLPLVRYRIGDRAMLASDEPCPCGRQMPCVAGVLGREDDVVWTSERGRIGSAALSTALYSLPGRLLGSQLQQTGPDEFLFRYIPAGTPLSEDECRLVERQLRHRLGDCVSIQIIQVTDIPVGKNGKRQLVVGLADLNRRTLASKTTA
jgi:phenylacetate-CoA ligase